MKTAHDKKLAQQDTIIILYQHMLIVNITITPVFCDKKTAKSLKTMQKKGQIKFS